jgi:hypothetical protein
MLKSDIFLSSSYGKYRKSIGVSRYNYHVDKLIVKLSNEEFVLKILHWDSYMCVCLEILTIDHWR